MTEMTRIALDSLCMIVHSILEHSAMTRAYKSEHRIHIENIRRTLEIEADRPLIKVPTPALPPDPERCIVRLGDRRCVNPIGEHQDMTCSSACDFGPDPDSKPAPKPPPENEGMGKQSRVLEGLSDNKAALIMQSLLDRVEGTKSASVGECGRLLDYFNGRLKHMGMPPTDSTTCPAREPMTDDEVDDMCDSIFRSVSVVWVHSSDYFVAAAIRATEKHHGIKP